jgi:tetratricopeptide (TPR) repeat protein
VTSRAGRSIGAGIIALVAFHIAPPAALAVDQGVIRLAQPATPAAAPAESPGELPKKSEARHGFDVEAFDGRFESLWFQRKTYESRGRDDEAVRQSDLIRDFVAEEGVRRLEIPAGALLVEAKAQLHEGSYDKALGSLALADALDPGRPQISWARGRVLWASGAGPFAAGAEWLRAVRGTVVIAFHDAATLDGLALVGVLAVLGAIGLFALLMAVRHHWTLRHDVEEWLIRSGYETFAKPGGWAVMWLPLILWAGAGWLALYWIALFFRYMRLSERTLAMVLLVATALSVPAYRFSVGLYGLSADPTVRTTVSAANGGYDPDRIVKLRTLVDAHPDDPMYRFLLAGLYKNGRYFEDAFQEYKRVLETAPTTYQARINLGNIYFALGQYGEAITNYRQALELRPDSALAYYDMYLAQSDAFKLKEAGESLAKAREFDPAQANVLLATGSRDGVGAKVVDATIDFDSIWRATLEGRHLRDWLQSDPEQPSFTSMLAVLANPTSVLALLAFAAALFSVATLRSRLPAQRCTRCGDAFCSYCKSGREGNEYCNPCLHLFVLRDGLAPESKSMKLYSVERHEARVRWGRRLASMVLPGASQILGGRSWLGFGLLTLWLLAWVGGYPAALAPFERALGLGIHWAGLRPSSVPALYQVDAILLLAIPLGAVVWLAGNVGVRRARGA